MTLREETKRKRWWVITKEWDNPFFIVMKSRSKKLPEAFTGFLCQPPHILKSFLAMIIVSTRDFLVFIFFFHLLRCWGFNFIPNFLLEWNMIRICRRIHQSYILVFFVIYPLVLRWVISLDMPWYYLRHFGRRNKNKILPSCKMSKVIQYRKWKYGNTL